MCTQAEHICERIIPRMQHANPAVVLSSVKVVLLLLNKITNQKFLKMCIQKLAPPLGSAEAVPVSALALCSAVCSVIAFRGTRGAIRSAAEY